MAKIEEEIQQKAFESEAIKLHVNILYTSSWITSKTNEVLKPYNISMQQYNLLRILRGAQPEPVSVKLLTERMIDKMSNASRLVEKLRAKKLVARTLSDEDRRRVDVVITKDGLKVLNKATKSLESMIESNFSVISKAEAKKTNKILDQLRG